MAQKARQITLTKRAARSCWTRKREPDQKRITGRALQARNKLIKIRDRYTCQNRACGKIAADVQVDHIVAVALGGGDEEENLQCLCELCNRLKALLESRQMIMRWPNNFTEQEVKAVLKGDPDAYSKIVRG